MTTAEYQLLPEKPHAAQGTDRSALQRRDSSSPLLAGVRSTRRFRSLFIGACLLIAIALSVGHSLWLPQTTRAVGSSVENIFGVYADDFASVCAGVSVTPCSLSPADSARPPQHLFQLKPVSSNLTAGDTLYVDIVSTASSSAAACLLRHSNFAVSLSGTRQQQAQFVKRTSESLTFSAPLTESGDYRVEAFLKLLNYPSSECDVWASRAQGRIVDKLITGGNVTTTVVPAHPTKSSALPSNRRLCEFGDMFDLSGQWSELPQANTHKGVYHKMSADCELPRLPNATEAFLSAKAAGVRWIRILGDSNSRFLYNSFPLVDPNVTPMRYSRRLQGYNLRAQCTVALDPEGAQQRNKRATRELCRVGQKDGDRKDDIVVSWEWFTPVHAPPLSAYFRNEPTPYSANATLAGLFSPPDSDTPVKPPPGMFSLQDVFEDRPDLLALRGGDRIILSYGSHATAHTRDDVEPYAIETKAAAEALYALQLQDPQSPQRRISFAQVTIKTCRKWLNLSPDQMTPEHFKNCNSENVRSKNIATLKALANHGLTQPDGSVLPPSQSPTGNSRVPIDVLDFWHTTEGIEDWMTDKVHFGYGVYAAHAQAVCASAFTHDVPTLPEAGASV